MDDERHGEGQFTFSTREVYEGRWIEDRISESKTLLPHVRITKLHCYCKHSVLSIG